MLSLLQLALLAVLGWGARAETGCPPTENIMPCHCSKPASPILTCGGIDDVFTLRDVFKNAEKYYFHEVEKLVVRASIMDSLFDLPPKSDSLNEIQLIRTDFTKNKLFKSGILKNLTNLRIIGVEDGLRSSFPEMLQIPADFGSRFPSSVRQITFKNTDIRRIVPGAFDGLENLDKFAMEMSLLENLTRDIFPRPFNVRFLYFNHNQISSLPGDLFTEMPNLLFLTLRNNSLSVVPEEAFGGRSTNVQYLGLQGNPLNCNCLLLWLIKDKPEMISGTCSTPARLAGRLLHELKPTDFNC